jgi:hypothetical protein
MDAQRSDGRWKVRTLVANVEEVFREAAARWVLIAYFAISTLFILVFSFAINLDVVNGALAGAKIFGQAVESRDFRNGGIDIEKLVLGFESGFSVFLYIVGTFLALFATAHLVPRLQEKGTIDLYLASGGPRPAALSRCAADYSSASTSFTCGVVWLIVVWKTRSSSQFFLAALVILLVIASFQRSRSSWGAHRLDRRRHDDDVLSSSSHLRGRARPDGSRARQWAGRGTPCGLLDPPEGQEMGRPCSLVAGEEAPASPAPSLCRPSSTAAFGVVCLTSRPGTKQRTSDLLQLERNRT